MKTAISDELATQIMDEADMANSDFTNEINEHLEDIEERYGDEPLDQQFLEDWVEALRSGEYDQGRASLRVLSSGVDSFCCLGVCLAMQDLDVPTDKEYIPQEFGPYVPDAILGSSYAGSLFAKLNDRDVTFETIADFVEEVFMEGS